MRTPNSRIGAAALLLSISLTGLAKAPQSHPEEARFSSNWDGRWQARNTADQCALELAISGYGAARFVAAPGRSLSFELVGIADLLASHGVSARTVAPSWHPRHPHQGDWTAVAHVPGFGLRLDNARATRLLMDFYEGYEQQMAANGVYGTPPDVLLTLSVLNFRAAYDDFQRCQQDDRPDSLLALHRTRVQFDSGKHGLAPASRKRLQQVATYVVQDPSVTQVYVDGYTDDVGTGPANIALSKRRANAVADLLAAAGVDRSLLVVRYHGERYPVVAERSEGARARNRRTTVRVETGGDALALQR